MKKLEGSVKREIAGKIHPLIDLEEYYELHNSSFESYLEKHGHWGYSRDAIEIRFYKETDVLAQLIRILSDEKEYFFFPICNQEEAYMGKLHQFREYYQNRSQETEHFILTDEELNWVLVKDEFNKLIGIGQKAKEMIASRIYLNPRLCFEGTAIMYQSIKKE